MERSVVVEGGDTLSAIALRELGDASKWTLLLDRNRKAIVAEQERRGLDWNIRHYEPESHIFPGTRLVIPGADNADRASEAVEALRKHAEDELGSGFTSEHAVTLLRLIGPSGSSRA